MLCFRWYGCFNRPNHTQHGGSHSPWCVPVLRCRWWWWWWWWFTPGAASSAWAAASWVSCSPETCIPAWAHPTRAWNTPACRRRPPWKPWCDQKPEGHEPWDSKIRFGFDFTANVTQPQTCFCQVNQSNLRSVWRWCEPLLCWCLRRCPCGLLLSRCSILDILSVSTSRKSKNRSQDNSVVRSWSGLFLLATIGNI